MEKTLNKEDEIASINERIERLKGGFRDYYSWSYEQLYDEEVTRFCVHPYTAKRSAKGRLRMYANLFNRDCRRVLIKEDSACVRCNSKTLLEIDHIIPISKGGLNEVSNVQILCESCNIKKKAVVNG